MKVKSEKGSISIYVLSACMLVLAVLMSVFMRNQTKLNTQRKQQKIIEQQYSDDSKIDEIYNRAISVKDDGYISDGLVLYLDGINNTGNGHDSNATTWKDLSGNGNDGTLNLANWTNNSFKSDSSNSAYVKLPNVLTSNNYTIQLTFVPETPNPWCDVISFTNQVKDYVNRFEVSNSTMYYWFVSKYNNSALGKEYSMTNSNITEIIDIDSTTKNSINIVSNTNTNNISIYKNLNLAYSNTLNDFDASDPENIFLFAFCDNQRIYYGQMYAARIYNRALTEQEIKHNYDIDKERFGL